MNKAISISLAKIDYDAGKPYIKIIADANCFKTCCTIDKSEELIYYAKINSIFRMDHILLV